MAEIVDIKAERKKLQDKAIQDHSIRNPVEELIDGIVAIQSEFPNRKEAEQANVELAEMNHKYAFVHSVGSKPMIKTMIYNEFFKKDIVEFITAESLQIRYLNRLAQETLGDPKKPGIQLGKWWLGHPHRKDYETVTFEPEKEPGEYHLKDEYKVMRNDYTEDKFVTYFNMWEGFGVIPKKGNWHKTKKHIYKILCNSSSVKFKYVIRWLAWSVQNPGNRAEVALIFKGKKGAGKGIILQSMVKIFGRHGLVISNREHLTGKHNQHLATCSFLFADEAYHPGDREVEGILKNLITEPNLTTEPKFRDLKISKNCLHITMATNADWIIPATEDERRYFINEVDNKYAKGECSDFEREEYFNHVWKEIENEGLEAMLYDLKNMNLLSWHPRKAVPETEELRRQIAMSLPKLKYAIMSMLEDGVFPGSVNGKGEYIISSTNLLEYLHKMETNNKSITGKALGKLWSDLKLTTGRVKSGRYYIFPELGKMRELWHHKVSKNSEWRTSDSWSVTDQY